MQIGLTYVCNSAVFTGWYSLLTDMLGDYFFGTCLFAYFNGSCVLTMTNSLEVSKLLFSP